MDFGLNPMHGKGKQPRAARGLEAFDRFHQADIAFLDQVGLVEAVAVVAAGDGNHHAQMRENQFFRRFQIAVLLALGQRGFFFGAEHRDAVYGVDVLIQTAVAAGDGQVDGFAHAGFLVWDGLFSAAARAA